MPHTSSGCRRALPTELDHLLTRIRTLCNCSTETIVVLDTIFDDLNMVGERRIPADGLVR